MKNLKSGFDVLKKLFLFASMKQRSKGNQIQKQSPEVLYKKKVFSEISQSSLENTCARVSFLLKKRLWHRFFPVNFEKFLKTPFFIEHLWWLLLAIR